VSDPCIRNFLVALCCSGALGCGDSEEAAPTPSSEVAVDFALRVNGRAFECDREFADVGKPPVSFKVTDARFYVHDLALIDADGNAEGIVLDEGPFQAPGLALLDFEDGCGPDGTAETHSTLTGRVASVGREFVGVRFTLGVPAPENFVNLANAAAPLDVTGMFWIWQFGYKYLKLDGSSPASGGGLNPFFLHIGASGCPGNNPQAPPVGACTAPNLASYELFGFAPGENTIVADVGALLSDSDLAFNTEETGPGCMSEPDDPECLQLLPRLGVDGAEDQQLFAVD
jgi:uncharacterized repeat protein (TIGR04052 family)